MKYTPAALNRLDFGADELRTIDAIAPRA